MGWCWGIVVGQFVIMKCQGTDSQGEGWVLLHTVSITVCVCVLLAPLPQGCRRVSKGRLIGTRRSPPCRMPTAQAAKGASKRSLSSTRPFIEITIAEGMGIIISENKSSFSDKVHSVFLELLFFTGLLVPNPECIPLSNPDLICTISTTAKYVRLVWLPEQCQGTTGQVPHQVSHQVSCQTHYNSPQVPSTHATEVTSCDLHLVTSFLCDLKQACS